MEGFLHIYYKQQQNQFEKQNFENVINQMKNTKHFYKIINNDRITGLYYTNEYSAYPYINKDKHLFCPVGQFIENKQELQSKFLLMPYNQILKQISNLAGAFAISNVDFERNVIDIYTHVVRAESVFIYEDESKTIVGTDPLIISTFTNNDLKPVFDASNFISFFEQGYFSDEHTPYEGVTSLPANSHIQINPNIDVISIDDTYQTAFSEASSDELFEEISTNFLNSFDMVTDKSNTIRSGLTGGKDIRVVLLGLLSKGYNVETHTTGFNDHPDVVVAKKLAEILNVPHGTNEKRLNDAGQISVDLEKRIHDITNASSGLITAYDSVNTKSNFQDAKNFNGVAASVITGGFNNFNHNIKGNITDSFKRPLYKFSDFYIDQNNKYNNFLEDFSTKNDDLGTLLHLFFLLYRSGRWTSDSRLAKSYASNSYSIFLDNQLTKSAMQLNMKNLREESIHYKLIEKLNPEVLNVPFYNDRFSFEKNGPQNPEDYSNWLLREPVYSRSKIGTYNWRSLGNNDPSLINAFKELILSRKNNIVFDVVKYNEIENLLNSKLTNRTNKFIWSIASMIYYTDYMANQHHSPIQKITLKTPSDKIIEQKIPSKIVDLTEAYMPLNPSLSMEKQHISFTNDEGNPYIKTYEGGFNKVPDSIELDDVKTINVNTNLTVEGLSDNLRKSVLFYTDSKRFKSIVVAPIQKHGDTIEFNQKIEVPKSAKYFRIAIYFKEKNDKSHKLNYSYAELRY